MALRLPVWNPMLELAAMHRAMGRMLGAVSEGGGERPARFLPVDVARKETGYEVRAELPGFKPAEVEVTLDQGTLAIRARRAEETRTEDGGYVRRELVRGSFVRAFELPKDVKAEDIKANYEDGVLVLTLPRAEAAQPVRIPVQGARPELPAAPEQPAAA